MADILTGRTCRCPRWIESSPRLLRCRPCKTSDRIETQETHVFEIRNAMLADQLDAVAGLDVPESYRAMLVRKDEQDAS